MKCYACGYEKRSKIVNVAEVKRYKSGKRKGEIKEVVENQIDVFEDDPNFIEISFAKGGIDATIETTNYDYYYNDGYKNITIYACPMCGTLKLNEEDL